MSSLRILCWNVNGVRAAARKGFLDWLRRESPDIMCLQETKARPDQLDEELREPPGYHAYWNYAETKGYSGVATFAREEPLSVVNGFRIGRYDAEGRVIVTEHAGFTLCNVYFPNGKRDPDRLQFKMDFYEDFLKYIQSLKAEGRKLVVCGDYNTAHNEIDLARPKENATVSGFLPMEREWLDTLVAAGFVDTFRHFNTEPDHYTWWDMKSRARERNVGWRINYFFVTADLLPSLTQALIMPEVMGSDHCPIGIVLRTD